MSLLNLETLIETAGRASAWNKPVLITHAKPDGDALGSLMALRAMLAQNGANPMALLYDTLPTRYSYFSRYAPMSILGQDTSTDQLAHCDGVILLDTCTYNQITPIAEWLRNTNKPKLVVDHHVTREALADHYLIDESAAATCQILYEWAIAADWSLSLEAIESLYIGMAMDTGWFRHSNTTERVMSIGADLLARGAKPYALHEALFQQETQARIKMLGVALHSLELFCEGRLAIMSVSAEAMSAVGATSADTEDIVNEPLRINSVVVSVLMVQQADCIKIGFRSKAPRPVGTSSTVKPSTSLGDLDIDVSLAAQTFDGGGHRRASGARLQGNLSDARDKMLSLFQELLTS